MANLSPRIEQLHEPRPGVWHELKQPACAAQMIVESLLMKTHSPDITQQIQLLQVALNELGQHIEGLRDLLPSPQSVRHKSR